MKLRVLVIDDDEDICLYLQEFLSHEGYRVSAFNKPLEALPKIKEGRHQIILLGVRMPNMDGVAMLREIRAVASDVCVIVMTAYPSVESAVDTMKAAAFDYLGKPVELDPLRAELQAKEEEMKGQIEGLTYRRRYIALRPVFRDIFNKFDKQMVGYIDASTYEGIATTLFGTRTSRLL